MAENAFLWSTTASDNDDADPAVPWPEGQLPGAVNNAARSLMAGVARLLGDLNGTLATTGSSNTYLVTSNTGHTTYTNGALITARANFTNTGAATLNLNSFGGKSIRVFETGGESAVAAGQIQSGGTYQFRYDSAANSAAGGWILLNPTNDIMQTARPGMIIATAVPAHDTTPPTGWLHANGQAVSRTTYATLFALFGTGYGIGDGSSTFNLPDLRGRAMFGKDDMGGVSAAGLITAAGSGIVGTVLNSGGGTETHTLTTAQLPVVTPAGTISQITPAGSISGTVSGSASGTVTVTDTRTWATSLTTILNTTGGAPVGTPSVGATILSTQAAVSVTAGSITAAFSAGSISGTLSGSFSGTPVTPTFTGTSFGSGNAHQNMPPARIMIFLVKY